MELIEFVSNFDTKTKVRIIQEEEVIFEGNVEVLEKLLRGKVKKHGCVKEDGTMVVCVGPYF